MRCDDNTKKELASTKTEIDNLFKTLLTYKRHM